MPLQRLHWSKRQLLSRLPAVSEAGVTVYRRPGETPPFERLVPETDASTSLRDAALSSPTGSVTFVCRQRVMLIIPPFPVTATLDAPAIDVEPLALLLDQPRAYAVLLLRLGGFSVGFFRGEHLVASKTDQRFVKNRHRKGGQSARRFERIREKQIHELFEKACRIARDVLAPYEREIQHAFLGGDRRTLQAFRTSCHYFDGFGSRLMSRRLAAPGDPRKAILQAIPREVWSSDVWIYEHDVARGEAT